MADVFIGSKQVSDGWSLDLQKYATHVDEIGLAIAVVIGNRLNFLISSGDSLRRRLAHVNRTETQLNPGTRR